MSHSPEVLLNSINLIPIANFIHENLNYLNVILL